MDFSGSLSEDKLESGFFKHELFIKLVQKKVIKKKNKVIISYLERKNHGIMTNKYLQYQARL
jgi:hypothetical protein